MNSRELAINVLYKVEFGEGYSNVELDKELNKSELSALDKALASEIVYGVLTWKITLDEIIKKYSSIRLKKISPWILNILRTGIYQIVFLDKIPESAAVNESVNLAKKYGHEVSSKFVNAILRKISKDEMDKLLEHLSTKPLTEEELISIVTSHPVWMVEELLKQYDKKFVTELLNANNITPEITIRANTLKTSRDELFKLLSLKNVDCKKGKLKDSIKVRKLTEFGNTLFSVQDEAAQLACLKLDPKPGDEVLDACSAPGGKTTYLAELMKNTGNIDAWDLHPHRVRLVEAAAKKLDISIINATLKDATTYSAGLMKRYDKILLDVPCSGLGVIRKKPDIKWTRKPEDILELQKIQMEILEKCSDYLKPGGRMVYSTCTVLKQENEEQVEKFLKLHDNFKLIEQINLFPHTDGADGFFIAVLERI
ncbi:MAG: 16S rRNA (cytosine(967)-C(5))-methyltransferase RsmB [Clostridia bacterium]|nr:16S rRNA (cytosine(967)-C(5))-methyltransferase RsmB [Clostridia bacterium]